MHGIRRTFLDIGQELWTKLTGPESASDPVFSANAALKFYFIGKMLWSKDKLDSDLTQGLGSLMD
ncbi:hypothetical protein ACHAWX_000513 [Stephanocyclus meneghinianus]